MSRLLALLGIEGSFAAEDLLSMLLRLRLTENLEKGQYRFGIQK